MFLAASSGGETARLCDVVLEAALRILAEVDSIHSTRMCAALLTRYIIDMNRLDGSEVCIACGRPRNRRNNSSRLCLPLLARSASQFAIDDGYDKLDRTRCQLNSSGVIPGVRDYRLLYPEREMPAGAQALFARVKARSEPRSQAGQTGSQSAAIAST